MKNKGIRETDLGELGRRFFAKEEDISQAALGFGREEITQFILEHCETMAGTVEPLLGSQIAYRLPGKPREWDASDDEQEFDISEIVTHVAAGVFFYWFGIARTLGHPRPRFPRAPRGAKLTGTTGQRFGRGGWGGVTGAELAALLRNSTRDFLRYASTVTEAEEAKLGANGGSADDLTIEGWLLLLAVHFQMHMQQISRMVMQVDFPRGDKES